MYKMIKHLDLKYDKDKLDTEFNSMLLEVYRPSRSKGVSWFDYQNDWYTKTLGNECQEVNRLRDLFTEIFNKKITAKFFRLKEGVEIPPHTDMGHKVCINIILEGSSPIMFRGGDTEYYNCAMINVAKRHSVPAGSKRKMVKFQIEDLFFSDAEDLWNAYYSG